MGWLVEDATPKVMLGSGSSMVTDTRVTVSRQPLGAAPPRFDPAEIVSVVTVTPSMFPSVKDIEPS